MVNNCWVREIKAELPPGCFWFFTDPIFLRSYWCWDGLFSDPVPFDSSMRLEVAPKISLPHQPRIEQNSLFGLPLVPYPRSITFVLVFPEKVTKQKILHNLPRELYNIVLVNDKIKTYTIDSIKLTHVFLENCLLYQRVHIDKP